jgi:hypothetical protein
MKTIKVNRDWLETLAEYAEEAGMFRDGDTQITCINSTGETKNLFLSISVNKLIGFASSAKSLLKYGGAK